MGAEWQFGYNCTHYLPTLGKCRVLIDMYSQRPDLLSVKSLVAEELLVYTGASPEELGARVDAGEIRVRRQKTDGKLRFELRAPWEWDECPLGDSGGQCLHFEPHEGAKITCLLDLERRGLQHPNHADIPCAEDVARFISGMETKLDSQPRA